MRQDRVRMAGLDKLKRGPAIMSGNRLVPEPDNRPIGIAGQLLSRGQDPHDSDSSPSEQSADPAAASVCCTRCIWASFASSASGKRSRRLIRCGETKSRSRMSETKPVNIGIPSFFAPAVHM